MYRFGAFQVDPRTHELLREGIRIKIQEQPFVVLLKLLEHPGELVTREELRRALWPVDTFVDFETGLNTVIKRLREALRDPAENPLFIETMPKLGYRFITPVGRWSALSGDSTRGICWRLLWLGEVGDRLDPTACRDRNGPSLHFQMGAARRNSGNRTPHRQV